MSLSWCPASVNIFPKDPNNYVGIKNLGVNVSEESTEKKDIILLEDETKPEDSLEQVAEDVKSKSSTENSVHKKINKRNIWSNLKHADDDELGTSNEENSQAALKDVPGDDDFLKECRSLMNTIMGRVITETTEKKCEKEKDRVVIKAKRKQDRTTEIQQKNLEENMELYKSAKNEMEEVKVLETSEDITNGDLVEVKGKNEDDTLPTKKDKKPEEKVPPAALEDADVEEPSKESIGEASSDNMETLGANMNVVDAEIVEEKANGGKTDETVVAEGNTISCGETKREIPVNIPVEEEPRREFLLASSGKEG